MLKWLVGKEGEATEVETANVVVTEDPLATLNFKEKTKHTQIYSVNR